ELQRVLAAYSDQVVMGDTLKTTLDALFTGGQPPPAPTVAEVSPPVAPTNAPSVVPNRNTPAGTGMQEAAAHYNRAIDALRAGNWSEFGSEMQKLGEQLGEGTDKHR